VPEPAGSPVDLSDVEEAGMKQKLEALGYLSEGSD
jgi:hypothetical protein